MGEAMKEEEEVVIPKGRKSVDGRERGKKKEIGRGKVRGTEGEGEERKSVRRLRKAAETRGKDMKEE
jgi:hypothetical protein